MGANEFSYKVLCEVQEAGGRDSSIITPPITTPLVLNAAPHITANPFTVITANPFPKLKETSNDCHPNHTKPKIQVNDSHLRSNSLLIMMTSIT